MKVLVVDEEKESVRKFERLLKNIDQSIKIIGFVPTLNLSADWISSNTKPDLILVNTKTLPDSGFNTTVIFSTPSEKYSFQAYRSSHFEDLLQSVVAENPSDIIPTKETKPAPLKYPRKRFLVKQGQKFASIELEAIAYFFSNGRFIFFRTFDDQKFLVEYTLEELELMLPTADFYRINRSLLISFKSVDQIHPYFGNRIKLMLSPAPDKDVIVSREKVNGFKDWLGQ